MIHSVTVSRTTIESVLFSASFGAVVHVYDISLRSHVSILSATSSSASEL